MRRISRTDAGYTPASERVLQFGEGNFLRAFVDLMIDQANRALELDMGVVVVQPIERGLIDVLNEQQGAYTAMLRGMVGGQPVEQAHVVGSVLRGINPYREFEEFLACARNPKLRIVISNTTEAGIAYTGEDAFHDRPPASFPGKLTRFLYERFCSLGATKESGLILIPCELIDHNGAMLKRCVLEYAAQWALPGKFVDWVEKCNVFADTLVDRIVTGYPRAEAEELQRRLGYRDALLDTAEPFGLWVIEAPQWVAEAFPLNKAGCPVVFADDVSPYKLRKVRMLNGAHTSMVCAAYLAGLNSVGECMADSLIRSFLERAIYDEIIPNVPLDEAELQSYARSLFERFENPFNRHLLLSIALNSISKYTARVLPTLLDDCARRGRPPACLTFGLAALIAFYAGGQYAADGRLMAARDSEMYEVMDVKQALDWFDAAQPGDAALGGKALAQSAFWDRDLTKVPGLVDEVQRRLADIGRLGMRGALYRLMGE